MTPSNLVQIAQENEHIVRTAKIFVDHVSHVFATSIIASFLDATTVTENVSIDSDCAPSTKSVVDVVHQGSVNGAKELAEKYSSRPLVLNFASAKRPGGGYLRGTIAQEEDLCRCSSLYYALKGQRDFYRLYDPKDPVYSDAFIYNREIVFFRNEDYSLAKPFLADVLTCAAPNNSKDDISRKVLEETFERRIDNILSFAILAGNTDLVLGAWGCGVFNNDPDMVASIFAKLLFGKFKDKFRHVRFAVFDKTKELKVLEAFKKHLEEE